MSERITEVNLLKQYTEDSQKYAIYVSRRRALPEYRDGFKPVHRKILYCMYADNKAINHTVKSARIVGEVLGRYHPHGDTAVYGAAKPMVNWFEINKPLIDKQGIFGSLQGSSAAAQRYTEMKLSKFTMECVIGELQECKQVVDWIPTYDEKDVEPEYLPASVPLLLINGSLGIAVGMKIEIPRHNLDEVIDATIALIHNPDASIALAPDHCMPCEIVNTNFKSISNKGFGFYTVRGIIDIEEDSSGRTLLVIKSVPDLTFLNKITDSIEGLIESNKLIQIQATRDETELDRMRFVLVLKKGSDPNFVRSELYKSTELQKKERINFEVLDGINPMRMSYKAYLLAFIEFRKITKFRLYCNRLQYIQTKIHERETYITVLQSGEIDNIVNMIRNQTSIDDNMLIEHLVTKLKVTDLQAKFVLGTDIKKLSKGYLNKYIEEVADYERQRQLCMIKITDDAAILDEIISELLDYKKKYGNPRRCKIVSEKDISDIPQGEFKIVVTESNFIKKIPLNAQIGSYRGDSPKCVVKVENTENILIFDELGKVFKLAANKVAFSDTSGTDIRMLAKNITSNINTIMYEPALKEFANKQNKYFMVVITALGYVKKLDIEDFLTVVPSGNSYIKLDNGDIVKQVFIVRDNADIIIYSDTKALRMNMVEVPHLKRNTKGNRSMNTNEVIDGVSIIRQDATDVVVITENGFINKFDVTGLKLSNRGKSGNDVIKLSKSDKIKCIYGINNKDSVRIISRNDKVVIRVADIPSGSSKSTGTKMLPMKNDNIVRCDYVKNKG